MNIQTANILGIFTDPFEFDGDYGPEANPIRQQVFELVVSRAALAKTHASNQKMSECRNFLPLNAVNEDKEYGPTLSELITPELIVEIKNKQIELQPFGFSESDLAKILSFLEHYKDRKLFCFLRNNPPDLLNLDKTLRDKAARIGASFDLPILGSIQPLEGLELKRNLIKVIFTQETLASTKSQESLKESLNKLHENYIKGLLGEMASNRDLETFCSPAGQVFFYWMYQALNLHLISIEPKMIEQVNKVKQAFAQTLGNPVSRVNSLKEKLIAAHTSILFTQESDALVPQILVGNNLFLPVERQNPLDGTLIFLRSEIWEPDYKILPIEGYEGFKTGKMNVILAKRKDSGKQFLLASCHGHSTKSEDGRLQISLIMEKFRQLTDGTLQLLIGTDANTKTEEDVKLFREHLDKLGLMCTQTGPTTIKRRMVTAQHSKAGRFAVDEEDYLITLKPENGGKFEFNHVTVGFKEEKADITQPLPNRHNPSDHYPIGAIMSYRG